MISNKKWKRNFKSNAHHVDGEQIAVSNMITPSLNLQEIRNIYIIIVGNCIGKDRK